MSVPELMMLTRKHWTKYLPNKVRELRASGELNEAIFGAANLAQAEIDHLMRQGYQEHEAREVALREFVLLPEETDEDDEQARERAEREAEYQRHPPVVLPDLDDDEWAQEMMQRGRRSAKQQSMILTPSQHMKLAALMHRKSQQASKPENRNKLAELAVAHRKIAKVRAEKAKAAQSEPQVADDATYQRALPFFKAGAADFANGAIDIKEKIRGLIRYLSSAGMSPEAIREMKPYLVRFIEDVQSGKESPDGIPSPIHGGDAGSEPENVPPAAGRRGAGSVTPRGMEYSVKSDLPYKMLDDPDPFDTVENLEQHLAELEAMPDFLLKDKHVDMLKRIIATSKRIEAEAKAK
jgi:hypothetical protein